HVTNRLRAPLAGIEVALELIDSREDGVRRRLATISEEVDELDRLVADVLTAARVDLAALPLRKVRTDLAMLIDRARLRALALDPSLPMDLEVEPGLSIEADEALLSRALDNLLDNARKYGNGSAVEVRARREGEQVILVVRDRVPETADMDLPQLFDPIF